ncbi:MAG: GNAT family N-acetyltransferase [Lachnospiraceae bacterium]|nr:GNAT family N-acetyltransferase [Lachnospiraceae bacterium]
MLRSQGRPAVIARTKRLTIREMTETDLDELVRIGGQSLSRTAGQAEHGCDCSDRNETACDTATELFSEERLRAYRRTAYRLQGFGLWSVLCQDRVIGCCGFEPCQDRNEHVEKSSTGLYIQGKLRLRKALRDLPENKAAAQPERDAIQLKKDVFTHTEHEIVLELQYMLDAAYRRKGLGFEMCAAVLEYARERLGADEIRVRIRPDNIASLRLAGKLGFSMPEGLR